MSVAWVSAISAISSQVYVSLLGQSKEKHVDLDMGWIRFVSCSEDKNSKSRWSVVVYLMFGHVKEIYLLLPFVVTLSGTGTHHLYLDVPP